MTRDVCFRGLDWEGSSMKAAIKATLAIIVAILVSWLVTFYLRSNVENFSDADAMLCLPKPQPPILTRIDAICYAVHEGDVADALRTVEQENKYLNGWMAKADPGEDFNGWVVRIKSRKSLPVFTCTISFTGDGDFTHQARCGFNK